MFGPKCFVQKFIHPKSCHLMHSEQELIKLQWAEIVFDVLFLTNLKRNISENWGRGYLPTTMDPYK